MLAVSRTCHLLSSLALGRCTALTDAALIAVGKGCPNLRSLNISRCPGLTDAALLGLVGAFHDVTWTEIVYMIEGATHGPKEEERVEGSSSDEDEEGGEEEEEGHNNQPRRRTATSKGRHNNTNVNGRVLTLEGVVRQREQHELYGRREWVYKLEELDLHGCFSMGDGGLNCVLAVNPNLHALDISRCPSLTMSSVIQQLAKSCRNIRRMEMASCKPITDEDVSILLSPSEYSEYPFYPLKALNMADTCRELSDAAVAKIAEACPLLTDLYLTSCTNLTNKYVPTLKT